MVVEGNHVLFRRETPAGVRRVALDDRAVYGLNQALDEVRRRVVVPAGFARVQLDRHFTGQPALLHDTRIDTQQAVRAQVFRKEDP